MTIVLENPQEPTTLAIEQLAEIVASHAAFQESVQLYSEADARERIFKSFHRPPDQQVELPFAVIFEAAGTGWNRLADGTVLPRGELFLHLGRPMDMEEAAELEERKFNNWCGQLATAINEYNGPGYRMLTTQTDPPSRTHPKDSGAQNPFWQTEFSVAWSAL